MCFLERAARRSLKYITPAVVTNMELHTRAAVNAAGDMTEIVYGFVYSPICLASSSFVISFLSATPCSVMFTSR
jgi:hypothetical protein